MRDQRVEEGCTATVCPHDKRDILGRVLIVHYWEGGGRKGSMRHWLECKGEWPREHGFLGQAH
jgi:hypothetical protein